MSHYVYILQSINAGSYYIGVTNDLNRRIKEYNHGQSRTTKRAIPWKLMYQEKHDSVSAAYQRERYIKSRKKRKYIEDIINQTTRA